MVKMLTEFLGKYFIQALRLGLVIVILLFAVMFIQVYAWAQKAEEFISFYPESIWEPEDNTYYGEYKGIIGLSEVSFKITGSEIEWFSVNQAGTTPFFLVKAEDFERHIEGQGRLDFDAVSGATLTSNFIKAAIINAVAEQ